MRSIWIREIELLFRYFFMPKIASWNCIFYKNYPFFKEFIYKKTFQIKQRSTSLPNKTAIRPQSSKAKSSWSRSENGEDLAPILQKHTRQVAACKQENNPNDHDR